jgi:hypothetical protein
MSMMCVNPVELVQPRNCFSKMVVSLSTVESARFSLRLLFSNRATASLTVTRVGPGREALFRSLSFASYSSSGLRLKSSAQLGFWHCDG